LLATGALRLVATHADIPTVAQAVLDAHRQAPEVLDFHAEIEGVWQAIVETVDRP